MAARREDTAGRRENAKSGKSLMHGGGESYCGIVPTKQPNKGGEPSAEVAEGRPWTKENTFQPNPCRTLSRKGGQADGSVCAGLACASTLTIRGKNRVR